MNGQSVYNQELNSMDKSKVHLEENKKDIFKMLPCCVIMCTAILIPTFFAQTGQICRHEEPSDEKGVDVMDHNNTALAVSFVKIGWLMENNENRHAIKQSQFGFSQNHIL